jgi:CheY-like chemotaxis protein
MILVVEDHADTRRALLRLLSLDGYEAAPAGCGQDALTLLKLNKPRLVILDCGLPDIDGLAVFRAIRSDPRLDDTRVVMFSAYDGSRRDEALAAGVDAYVLKGSLDLLHLLDEIRRFAGPPDQTLANKQRAGPADALRGATDACPGRRDRSPHVAREGHRGVAH